MLSPLIYAALMMSAHASSVNVQGFLPGSSFKYPVAENASPELPVTADPEHYSKYTLGLSYNYLNSPIVELDSSGGTRTATLVDSMSTFDLQAGVEWNSTMGLYVALPITGATMPGSSSTSVGDIRFFSKIYLNSHPQSLNFALIPEVSAPTGSKSNFTSNSSATAGLLLAMEHDFKKLSLAFNVGYRYSPDAIYANIDYRQKLPFILGAYVPFDLHWGINAEASKALMLPSDSNQSPGEFYAGLRYLMDNSFTMNAGGAIGANKGGVESADYRIVVGLKWSPTQEHPTLAQNDNPAPLPVPAEAAPAVAPPVAPTVIAAGPKAEPKKPRVVFTPRRLIIREEIKFEHNSDVLLPSARNLLDEVAHVLKKNKSRYHLVRIEGHCNELGTDAYNLKLSKARSKSVREYLASRGINPKRLASFGYGKRKPKSGLDDVSRKARLAANRRVEFKVVQ